MRQQIEAMLWIARTGAPWRDLPEYFGPWKTVYSSFSRWSKNGLWQFILAQLAAINADEEYLMIDSSTAKVHQHASGPVGGQLAHAMGRSRAGLATKIHMACDALGYPLGFILTGANVSDFDQCKPLLKRHLKASSFAIMDMGYDSDAIRFCVNQPGGTAVMTPHPNRACPPAFDGHLYRERHRIENLFAKLKAFRRIATRYEKLHSSFAAMLSLVCILIWLKY
jgi:transposase